MQEFNDLNFFYSFGYYSCHYDRSYKCHERDTITFFLIQPTAKDHKKHEIFFIFILQVVAIKYVLVRELGRSDQERGP